MTSRSRRASLASAQAWLVAASTHSEGPLAGAAALGAGYSSRRAVERVVTRGPSLSALDRLRIYNDGYHARLIECLIDDYPALHHALGSDAFTVLARAYITAHPSRSPSLDRYGSGFAAFCAERAEAWSAFGSELASLEWAIVNAIHAPPSAPLDPATFARLPPERLACARFTPCTSLSVLRFTHPVNEYFQAFMDERDPALPAPRPTAVAVTREGMAIVRRALEPLAATLLTQLVTGAPLGQALEVVMRNATDTDARQLAESLQRWFANFTSSGFFAAVATHQPTAEIEN